MGYLRLFLEQLKYSWGRKFSLQATTFLVMVGSFLVVTVTALILSNTNTIFTEVAESFQVSVYLKDKDEKSESKSKVMGTIKAAELFSEIRFVSKESALADFKSKMKDQMPNFIIEEGDINPLPASYSLKIKKTFNNKAGFEKISNFVDSLISENEVEDVSYGKSWMNQYSSILSAYNLGSLAFILFLLLSIVLVVGNSIKSSISQRRREIEVLELVGATRAYIRLPFILEGAFMGLISSLSAVAITYLLLQGVVSFASNSASSLILSSISIHFLNVWQIVAICLVSTLIGAVGATICIGRMNTGWAASSD